MSLPELTVDYLVMVLENLVKRNLISDPDSDAYEEIIEILVKYKEEEDN